jgi:hypothetical protein
VPAAERIDRGNLVELHEGIVEHDWPLIPDAVYEAVLTHYEGCVMHSWKNAAKVYLHFKIVTPGEHFGTRVYRAYNVRRLRGKVGKVGTPQKNCGFAVGRRSELLRMLVRVLDLRIRPDRVSLLKLKGSVLRIRTRTVTKGAAEDGRQIELPAALRYSVVADILGKNTGA